MKSRFTFLMTSVFLTLFCISAMASRSVSSYSGEHKNYLSAAFGLLAPGQNLVSGSTANGTQTTATFNLSGFFGIGGDYDYMLQKDLSLGGILRYYNVSTTINNQSYQNTLFTLGPTVKGYLPSGNWLPYATAGLVFMSPGITYAGTAITIPSGMGLLLGLGMLYQINDTVGVGIETTRLTGLSNNINGNLIEDYMFKGRFALGN